MSRKARCYAQTSFFHVMTQGINKSFIFNNSIDIKYYIKILYQLKKDYCLEIIAYCIMNNHTHMLIKVEKIEELSRFMQRVNTKYGKYYNRKYDRVGYVFRDRYKAEGIYDEKQLYSCIKYIYDNPVKAGICRRAEDYPYSNYKKINYQVDDYLFIDTDEEMNREIEILMRKFLNKNNIELSNIEENRAKLQALVQELRDRYQCSFSKISKMIHVNKEKVRRIYNGE